MPDHTQTTLTDEQHSHETYSETLQCPYCDCHFLSHNALSMASPGTPCRHLIVFDAIFTTYIRTSDTEFHTLTDRTHESFSDQITGRPTVVHDSPPDERLGDAGWTAIYHRHPQTVLQPLSEIINHETE